MFIPFELVLPGMNVAIGIHLKYSTAAPMWLMFFKEIIGLKIVCINNSKRFVLSVPGCSNILLLFSNCQFPKSIKLISSVLFLKKKKAFCGTLREMLCSDKFSTERLGHRSNHFKVSMHVLCYDHFSSILQLVKSPCDSETGVKRALLNVQAFVLVGIHDCHPYLTSPVYGTKHFTSIPKG